MTMFERLTILLFLIAVYGTITARGTRAPRPMPKDYVVPPGYPAPPPKKRP